MSAFLFALICLSFTPDSALENSQRLEGFFNLAWNDEEGRLFLQIRNFHQSFLLLDGIATGIGSNDIGLDRGQMGRPRLVHFERSGQKVFLVEENPQFRATSNNAQEQQAVRDSFAYGILWATQILAEENGAVWVDLSDLAISDLHGTADRLMQLEEGRFQVDSGRSYYFQPNCKAFPDNTEIEAVLTFMAMTGNKPSGPYLATVAPNVKAISLRQHISFVRLPDDRYTPRAYHNRSGGMPFTYYDYAAPLDEPIRKTVVARHRLVPQHPNAAVSEPVEPIVYYVDSGAPEQIRKALIEGASWWEQAFEAAGFKNAFQVKVLPQGVDPMDVRYNVIQWVHRYTRGWSYGDSICDPRTGEIIKGHVTLGSLRVRQDRLLFEGLIGKNDRQAPNPVDLALDRIRQLAAHEVAHTLGLLHNFAASSNDRASVTDYPAPLITLKDGKLDFSQAYDQKIGLWDKLAIKYLYGYFKDEEEGLKSVLAEAEKAGLLFIADQDARGWGTLHPTASLWDNGQDAIAAFDRTLQVRHHALQNFGPQNLWQDLSLAHLEEVLVPVYLHHRFQLRALVKTIGGAWFDYGDNDGKSHYKPVAAQRQKAAFDSLMGTLDPAFLVLPEHLQNLIPPRGEGDAVHREMFDRRTGGAFDELALAETSISFSLDLLLVPQRLNRLYNQYTQDHTQFSYFDMIDTLLLNTVLAKPFAHRPGALQRMVNYQVIRKVKALIGNDELREDARAWTLWRLKQLAGQIKERHSGGELYEAHRNWILAQLHDLDADEAVDQASRALTMPPGSPIGN